MTFIYSLLIYFLFSCPQDAVHLRFFPFLFLLLSLSGMNSTILTSSGVGLSMSNHIKRSFVNPGKTAEMSCRNLYIFRQFHLLCHLSIPFLPLDQYFSHNVS